MFEKLIAASTTLSEVDVRWLLVIMVGFVILAGVVVIVGRSVLERKVEKNDSDKTLVRSWIAVSLVGGLLIFCAASFGVEDASLRSALIGGLVATSGAAVAFYFASKGADQTRKDILDFSARLAGVTNPVVTSAPTVTGIKPNTGDPKGGTSVVVTGTAFDSASKVSFGSAPSTSVKVDSATQITAVSPAGTGTVDVIVTTPAGTSPKTAADQFKYDNPVVTSAPTVTGIKPNTGDPKGGTSVVVTGTAFDSASKVSFGSAPSTSVKVDSATQITAVSPAGTGTVDVIVTTPAGTSPKTVADQFKYDSGQPS